MAYVPQEPWVFSGSVQENILFGKGKDMSWYDQILQMSALVKASLLIYNYL